MSNNNINLNKLSSVVKRIEERKRRNELLNNPVANENTIFIPPEVEQTEKAVEPTPEAVEAPKNVTQPNNNTAKRKAEEFAQNIAAKKLAVEAKKTAESLQLNNTPESNISTSAQPEKVPIASEQPFISLKGLDTLIKGVEKYKQNPPSNRQINQAKKVENSVVNPVDLGTSMAYKKESPPVKVDQSAITRQPAQLQTTSFPQQPVTGLKGLESLQSAVQSHIEGPKPVIQIPESPPANISPQIPEKIIPGLKGLDTLMKGVEKYKENPPSNRQINQAKQVEKSVVNPVDLGTSIAYKIDPQQVEQPQPAITPQPAKLQTTSFPQQPVTELKGLESLKSAVQSHIQGPIANIQSKTAFPTGTTTQPIPQNTLSQILATQKKLLEQQSQLFKSQAELSGKVQSLFPQQQPQQQQQQPFLQPQQPVSAVSQQPSGIQLRQNSPRISLSGAPVSQAAPSPLTQQQQQLLALKIDFPFKFILNNPIISNQQPYRGACSLQVMKVAEEIFERMKGKFDNFRVLLSEREYLQKLREVVSAKSKPSSLSMFGWEGVNKILSKLSPGDAKCAVNYFRKIRIGDYLDFSKINDPLVNNYKNLDYEVNLLGLATLIGDESLIFLFLLYGADTNLLNSKNQSSIYSLMDTQIFFINIFRKNPSYKYMMMPVQKIQMILTILATNGGIDLSNNVIVREKQPIIENNILNLLNIWSIAKNEKNNVYDILYFVLKFNEVVTFFNNINVQNSFGYTPLYNLLLNKYVDLPHKLELITFMQKYNVNTNNKPSRVNNSISEQKKIFGLNYDPRFFPDYCTIIYALYTPSEIKELENLLGNCTGNIQKNIPPPPYPQGPPSAYPYTQGPPPYSGMPYQQGIQNSKIIQDRIETIMDLLTLQGKFIKSISRPGIISSNKINYLMRSQADLAAQAQTLASRQALVPNTSVISNSIQPSAPGSIVATAPASNQPPVLASNQPQTPVLASNQPQTPVLASASNQPQPPVLASTTNKPQPPILASTTNKPQSIKDTQKLLSDLEAKQKEILANLTQAQENYNKNQSTNKKNKLEKLQSDIKTIDKQIKNTQKQLDKLQKNARSKSQANVKTVKPANVNPATVNPATVSPAIVNPANQPKIEQQPANPQQQPQSDILAAQEKFKNDFNSKVKEILANKQASVESKINSVLDYADQELKTMKTTNYTFPIQNYVAFIRKKIKENKPITEIMESMGKMKEYINNPEKIKGVVIQKSII